MPNSVRTATTNCCRTIDSTGSMRWSRWMHWKPNSVMNQNSPTKNPQNCSMKRSLRRRARTRNSVTMATIKSSTKTPAMMQNSGCSVMMPNSGYWRMTPNLRNSQNSPTKNLRNWTPNSPTKTLRYYWTMTGPRTRAMMANWMNFHQRLRSGCLRSSMSCCCFRRRRFER